MGAGLLLLGAWVTTIQMGRLQQRQAALSLALSERQAEVEALEAFARDAAAPLPAALEAWRDAAGREQVRQQHLVAFLPWLAQRMPILARLNRVAVSGPHWRIEGVAQGSETVEELRQALGVITQVDEVALEGQSTGRGGKTGQADGVAHYAFRLEGRLDRAGALPEATPGQAGHDGVGQS